MNKLADFVITALATYRLSKLVMQDVITEDLRDKYWDKFPRNTKMGYLLTCPWCVSIWTAGAIVGAKKVSPALGELLANTLAASAVVGLAAEKGI